MLEVTKHLESYLDRELKKDCQYNQIPSIFDGLKPIERCVLSVIIKLSIENKNGYILSKNIILKCLETLEFDVELIYKVICILVNNKKSLFITKGNFGCLDYPENQKESDWNCTSIKLNPILYDFYKINNEISEYLPFIVPIGLIGNNISIKVGKNQTISPKYKIYDLLIRLKSLITNDVDLPKIKPNIEGCLLSEVSNGFTDILENGIGTINISPKNIKNVDSITLLGSTPIRKFNKLLEEAKQVESKTKTHMFNYSCSIEPFSLTLYPITESLPKFITKINSLVSESIKFNNIVVNNDGNIQEISIDKILKSNFERYKKYKISQLETKINQLNNVIKQINIAKLIVENISVINDKDFITKINNDNKYSQEDIKTVLNNIPLTKLISLPKVDDKEKELVKLQNQLENIDEIIKNELDTFVTITNKEGL